MIVRKCAQGHDIVLHKNNRPGMKKTIQLANGDLSTLTYPSAAKDYFLWVDGEITKRSDSFETCEKEVVKVCEAQHTSSNGRMDLVKHKLVNNKVVER